MSEDPRALSTMLNRFDLIDRQFQGFLILGYLDIFIIKLNDRRPEMLSEQFLPAEADQQNVEQGLNRVKDASKDEKCAQEKDDRAK